MAASSNAVPDAASVRAQLRRILASNEFAASERISRFLQFAVMETLAGRQGALKEYRVGIEVFDRPESFDSAIDPIVRVEARRLRSKLAKYYETEGRFDDMVIELPKGGYVPAFRRRQKVHAPDPGSTANRLAVLPFVSLSGSEEGAYLADGLTWELIHGLTRVKSLAVLAWHSSAELRGDRAPEIAEVRAKLRAQWLVVGSVRRWNNHLRVVAQLIDVTTGVYLWSQTLDRSVEHAADIQQEIAEAIVATLRARLGVAEMSLPAPRVYNPEAYRLYLRARGKWNCRTEAGLREALDDLRQVVAIDDNFAIAHAGMADAYALLSEYGIERPSEVIPLAKAAALRALELDPSLGEAHCSLGLLAALHEWNWREAEAHFRRALVLNPGYATAHHWFASDFLPIVGGFEEASREIEIALALDPLSWIISEGKAFLRLVDRDYAGAETELLRILQAAPSFYKAFTSLGRIYIQMGFYDKALDCLKRGRTMAGDIPTILGAMGQAYALNGNAGKARELLAQLLRLRETRYAPATCLALIHLGLAEPDRSIEWLTKGVERRESNTAHIHIHPAYDPLRSHPAFPGLVERLGLPG